MDASTQNASPQIYGQIISGLKDVSCDDWNRVAGLDYPFTRHEFLLGLEEYGCVGDSEGWGPRHALLLRDHKLVGAMPMYLKNHSYGEFVFDWGWAEAYARAGLEYYPKLVVAIPFTPATGPRLLVDPDDDVDIVRAGLVGVGIEAARQLEASSVHWLFTLDDDANALSRHGMLKRAGCQFHWHNPGYKNFDEFLSTLSSKKRKQIRRERRQADDAPVKVEVLLGGDVKEQDWDAYHALYSSTYDRKWGFPSLTADFFKHLGQNMPDDIMLVIAKRGDRCVAGAHLLKGPNALYGRNWGCSEFHACLHFEMCYYRPIEFCIEHGLPLFEAGAQGEHKLSRGFLPTTTSSSHWVAHDRFRDAIADFLERERMGIEGYVDEMQTHSPFKRVDDESP